ncbi:hypothetical protein OPAG_06961 [Rhodococcus opacus PD630]|nr:hypothetical protein OPAG_06961 [Rhodococcus opacus PD630]
MASTAANAVISKPSRSSTFILSPLMCQRGPASWTGRRSSAYIASILALISAVLMPPLRRTGGREEIEDAGIIEAVVAPYLSSCPRFGTPIGVHLRHSDVTRFRFSAVKVVPHRPCRRQLFPAAAQLTPSAPPSRGAPEAVSATGTLRLPRCARNRT